MCQLVKACLSRDPLFLTLREKIRDRVDSGTLVTDNRRPRVSNITSYSIKRNFLCICFLDSTRVLQHDVSCGPLFSPQGTAARERESLNDGTAGWVLWNVTQRALSGTDSEACPYYCVQLSLHSNLFRYLFFILNYVSFQIASYLRVFSLSSFQTSFENSCQNSLL